MAYDEVLAARIREALATVPAEERKMFGGLAFLRHGRMVVGIVGRDLMVRVGPAAYAEALRRPHARPMDFTGRPMRGYVYVGPQGCATPEALADWVHEALAFVATLPAEKPKAKRRARWPRKE